MTAKRLHLLTNNEHIGWLDQDKGGAIRLTVPPTDKAPRLSLAFAPSHDPISPKKTRAYIEGLLPENLEVRKATAARVNANPDSPFSLLAAIGRDCPGAVQFFDDDGLQDTNSGTLTALSDSAIAARLRNLRENPDASWLTQGEHWSLGGQQSKFALRLEDNAWHEAHGSEPTTHIVKPGVAGLKSQALVEHVSMRTLAIAGLPVAKSQFIMFEDEPAIVVERYDRFRDGDHLYRIHQEDLCQATSTLPTQKYQVPAQQAARVMRSGGADRSEIVKFMQAVLANWLIGAPDAHAKNFSVLLTPEDIRLAPLYDVATGFNQTRDYDSMAMKIGSAKKFRDVKIRHLREFAKSLELEENEVLESALTLAILIPAAYNTAVTESEFPPSSIEHLQQIGTTIEKHCNSVLSQFSLLQE